MELWDIAGIAERWKRAYCPKGLWRNETSWRDGKSYMTDRESVYQTIVSANGDTDKIDAAIGNNTWTQFHCGECDERKPLGMVFDNGDGGHVVICADCLQKALNMCEAPANAL